MTCGNLIFSDYLYEPLSYDKIVTVFCVEYITTVPRVIFKIAAIGFRIVPKFNGRNIIFLHFSGSSCHRKTIVTMYKIPLLVIDFYRVTFPSCYTFFF